MKSSTSIAESSLSFVKEFFWIIPLCINSVQEFKRKLLFNGNGKLSIKQLREFKGLENILDSQAIEIINGLYQFSLLTMEIHKKNNYGSTCKI